MSKVRTGMSVSVDGFIGSTGDRKWDDHDRVHSWVCNLKSWRQAQGMDGDDNADSDVLAERQGNIGAHVMGRTMFDYGDQPCGDEPPFHAPVFVLTTRPREADVRKGGTTFTFVTDGIEVAIERAKAAAGDKDVFISGGGSAVHQALAAGVLDEFQMHVVPVLLGDGVRLFDQAEPEQFQLQRTHVAGDNGVTHLTYRVVR